MGIIIRNETSDDISLSYKNVDFTLEPNKFIEIESLDELMLDSHIIKVRRGVIKIKGAI